MATNYWIKLYHEILEDPKMGVLPDSLWRRCIELFLLAGDTDEGGYLPAVGAMAWKLRLSPGDLLSDLEQLSEVEIVEKQEDGRWYVCNFAERQRAVSGAERTRQSRKRQKQKETPPQGENTSNESVTDEVTTRNVRVTKGYLDTDIDTDKEEDKIPPTPKRPESKVPGFTFPAVLDKPEFRAAWCEFVAHRAEIKRPLTERAGNMQLKKLADKPVTEAVAMIEQSIANGWQGIFELKNPLPSTNGRHPALKNQPLKPVIGEF